tara:strand:+ start:269 stop:433 length:165 start_codon:yes stop_codon:yes gene_type:complete
MEESVVEFLAGFNGSAWSDWATFVCFMAIPVGLVAGWCIEAWRQGDLGKKVEKR